jgi:hypothetical protein
MYICIERKYIVSMQTSSRKVLFETNDKDIIWNNYKNCIKGVISIRKKIILTNSIGNPYNTIITTRILFNHIDDTVFPSAFNIGHTLQFAEELIKEASFLSNIYNS